MNWVKKTVFFIGLIFLFFVAFSATEYSSLIKVEKQSSTKFSLESIQNPAFIQPQPHYTANVQLEKDSNPIIKWQAAFLTASTAVKKLSCSKAYINQDINRCEKVSILLFPFHFFW
ncbi:MAG: hypothetical protein P8I78_08765 [Flavobacterium sp.]|nr:hypothetical protein [Flavobacterium sp.]